MIAIAVAVTAWQLRTDSTEEVDIIDLTSAITGEAPDLSGDVAPVFSVPLIGGGDFDLAAHLANDGRPLLLNLWASWCAPCRKEMPAIEAASQRHPGVRFLGVAVQDDPVEAEAFATEIGVTYDIGVDDRERVDALYPAFGLPTTFLISGDGIILATLFGEIDGDRIDTEISTWFGG